DRGTPRCFRAHVRGPRRRCGPLVSPGGAHLADDPPSQPHPATAVPQQGQAVQLPVTVLGMVRQQTSRLLAGDPARHVHVDKFVFRHRIYCAVRGPVRIASALCLMLRSPPLPRYAPPPRRSRPRSTATLPRSNAGRGTTTRPSTRRSTSWPLPRRRTTNCSTTATTR